MSLLNLVDLYCNHVGASLGYRWQLIVLVRRLADWTVTDLTVPRIDAYLTAALAKLSPSTVQNHRRMLGTLRRFALREGLAVDQCTRTLRRVKTICPNPIAWTQAEISHLVEVAREMPGRTAYCNLCEVLPAYVIVAYTTGLRAGDMLSIRHDQIRGDRLSLVIHKTNQPHVAVLTDQCLAAIRELPRRGGRIFGDLIPCRQLSRHFRRLVLRAGMAGSSKFLRRSSATFAELNGIDATGHLGHRTAQMKRHYVDMAIMSQNRRAVPPLELVHHS
jgi:integrase